MDVGDDTGNSTSDPRSENVGPPVGVMLVALVFELRDGVDCSNEADCGVHAGSSSDGDVDHSVESKGDR